MSKIYLLFVTEAKPINLVLLQPNYRTQNNNPTSTYRLSDLCISVVKEESEIDHQK